MEAKIRSVFFISEDNKLYVYWTMPASEVRENLKWTLNNSGLDIAFVLKYVLVCLCQPLIWELLQGINNLFKIYTPNKQEGNSAGSFSTWYVLLV